MEVPPACDFRERTLPLPSSDRLWQSRNALAWSTQCKFTTGDDSTRQNGSDFAGAQAVGHQADSRQVASTESSSDNGSLSLNFVPKFMILEVFLDEQRISSQLRHSQLLQSSFALSLGDIAQGGGDNTKSALAAMLLLHKSSTKENDHLDRTIDSITLTEHEQNDCRYSHEDTLLHVLGILRRVPLKTLHRATGWQTNEDQMRRSRAKISDFFRDQSREARRCLWHATCIFSATRSTRLLACYDTFSIMVSTCYLFCHSEFHPTSHAQSDRLLRSAHPLQREPVVRLDRLRDRSSIEHWIQDSTSNRPIHLTGIGLLEGPYQSARLLNDVENTLSTQVAWRGFANAFATCFKQLGRGENPSLPAEVN